MNELTEEMARLIAHRVSSRRKPCGLFKSSFGFELKQPYQMRENDIYHQDYVGTYTAGVTAQQIIDDWS